MPALWWFYIYAVRALLVVQNEMDPNAQAALLGFIRENWDSLKRASRAVRMFIVAKRATRDDAVNGTVVPVGGGASAMAILEA